MHPFYQIFHQNLHQNMHPFPQNMQYIHQDMHLSRTYIYLLDVETPIALFLGSPHGCRSNERWKISHLPVAAAMWSQVIGSCSGFCATGYHCRMSMEWGLRYWLVLSLSNEHRVDDLFCWANRRQLWILLLHPWIGHDEHLSDTETPDMPGIKKNLCYWNGKPKLLQSASLFGCSEIRLVHKGSAETRVFTYPWYRRYARVALTRNRILATCNYLAPL
jgi:hypothetical protein